MHFNLNKSIRKLRPIESVAFVNPIFPAPVEISDWTEAELNTPTQIFARISIKNALDSQAKIIRRTRPRVPKTPRELQLVTFLANA